GAMIPCAVTSSLLLPSQTAQSAPPLRHTFVSQSQPANPVAASEPTAKLLTLADLQQTAIQNNPTLAQAEALIRSARGRAKQAGLMPNPVIGYEGAELAFKYFDEKSEHFGFVE